MPVSGGAVRYYNINVEAKLEKRAGKYLPEG
jgi:hypothetical protein